MSEPSAFVLDRTPYFILWGITLFWGWSAMRVWRSSALKIPWSRVLWILVVVVAVFWLVKPQLRVLSDEAELLAVSKAMTLEARLDYANEGYWQDGRFVTVSRQRELKPFGFPFIVHLLHRLTGFRPENIFVLNFFLLAGTLALIYGMVLSRAGPLWALAAVFAVLAQPIVLLCAASGGLELFQLFFILFSLAACLWAWEEPENESRFRLAWMSLVLLAHTRYESVLFFLLVIPAFLWTHRSCLRHLSRSPVYALTPVFLLPLLMQRLDTAGYFPPSLPPQTVLWSFENWLKNLGLFWQSLAAPVATWPYNRLVNILGLLSLAGTFFVKRPKNERLLLFFGLAALLQIAGLTAYAESGLNLPQSARYFLLGSVLLSMAAVWGIRRLVGKKLGGVAAVFFAAIFLGSLPVAMVNKHWDENKTNSEYRFVRGIINGLNLDAKKTILLVQRPVLYASQGFGSVSFAKIVRDPIVRSQVRQAMRSGKKIFMVRTIPKAGASAQPTLPEDWSSHPIARFAHPSGISWEICEVSAGV